MAWPKIVGLLAGAKGTVAASAAVTGGRSAPAVLGAAVSERRSLAGELGSSAAGSVGGDLAGSSGGRRGLGGGRCGLGGGSLGSGGGSAVAAAVT